MVISTGMVLRRNCRIPARNIRCRILRKGRIILMGLKKTNEYHLRNERLVTMAKFASQVPVTGRKTKIDE